MDLREFVGQALSQVIEGVLDAQKALGQAGKFINPELSTQQGPLQKQGHHVSIQGQLMQSIEFDVAVTATEGTGTKGGIVVVAGMFALGSQGQSTAESSVVSRIKFAVPVTLPYGERMSGRA